MIPFHTWLTQIVEYSRFISSALSVRRAWIEADYSKTSVTDFDELYEQVFDDLDSDVIEQELGSHFPTSDSKRQALAAFLEELRVVDIKRSVDSRLKSPAALLASNEWSRLVEAARRVESMFPLTEGGREQPE